jgi:diguanylate cyclase (GGDEF)-like protein
VSSSGIILDANDFFSHWFSSNLPSIVGNKLSEVLGVDEALLSEVFIACTDNSDLSSKRTILLPDVGGSPSLTVAAVPRGNGNAVVTVVDSSRRTSSDDDLARAHAASVRESERLKLLLAASVSFANATSGPELANLLADATRRSFRADSASVHLIEGGEFSLAGGHSPLAERWPAQAPPTGLRTMQLGKVLKIVDPGEAEPILPNVGIATVMQDSGVHSILVAPISDQKTPIGTVACYFTNRRTFDEQAEPLIRALSQQAAQVFTRLRLEEQLRRSAMLDEITGLPTRRLFEQQIHQDKPTTAVMFLDLDGFKKVNDDLGHATGDHLLSLVAQRLRAIFRRTDSIARYGGDEFVAIIDATTHDEALTVAERARTVIAEPFPFLPARHRITASIGVAIDERTSDAPLSTDRLIRLADHAMYTAKARGGNTTELERLVD